MTDQPTPEHRITCVADAKEIYLNALGDALQQSGRVIVQAVIETGDTHEQSMFQLMGDRMDFCVVPYRVEFVPGAPTTIRFDRGRQWAPTNPEHRRADIERGFRAGKTIASAPPKFRSYMEAEHPTPTAEQKEAAETLAREFMFPRDGGQYRQAHINNHRLGEMLAQLLATREAEARVAGFRDGYAAGVTDEREEDDVIRAEARADERRKIRDMLVASSLDETPSQTLDRVYAEMCEDVPRADRNVIALEPAERQPNIDEARLATRIADSLVPVDPDDQVTRAAFQEGLFRLLVKYPMIDKRAAFDIARWARREEER